MSPAVGSIADQHVEPAECVCPVTARRTAGVGDPPDHRVPAAGQRRDLGGTPRRRHGGAPHPVAEVRSPDDREPDAPRPTRHQDSPVSHETRIWVPGNPSPRLPPHASGGRSIPRPATAAAPAREQ
jgi:hypothetical protein